MAFLKRNVLFVDDDHMARVLVQSMLSQAGYSVTTADDGFSALELLHKYPFDLLILDIMMTKMSGLDLLKRIKANASTKDVPVMMLSNRDDVKVISIAKSLGAQDYMLKPPQKDVLLRKIETILGGRPRFAEVQIDSGSEKSHCQYLFEGQITHIGESGLTLQSPIEYKPSSTCRLNCRVLKEIGVQTNTFQVSFCQKEAHGFTVFVTFVGLRPDEVAAIRNWVVAQAFKGRVVA